MTINIEKYQFLKPRKGYVAVKVAEETKKQGMISSGATEDRAYGYIVARHPDDQHGLELGELVVYNEYEGQELFKFEKITEDGILIIKADEIICSVK